MSVLDPFEVAEIEMWPLWDLEQVPHSEAKQQLADLEYSVYQKAVYLSVFASLLNEKDVPIANAVELPESYRSSIIPEDLHRVRSHPDMSHRSSSRYYRQPRANNQRTFSQSRVAKNARRTSPAPRVACP